MTNPLPTMHLTDRELATTLAALRTFQHMEHSATPPNVSDHFLDCDPLESHEIDSLCERLNTAELTDYESLVLNHPFTPGKWTAERAADGELALWDEHDNNLLVSESDLPREEREANAELMARAPVMHHALRLIAGIAGMQVLSGNSEPDDMAANLEEISNNLGEIQGIIRKALIQGITPSPWIPISEFTPHPEEAYYIVATEDGETGEAYQEEGAWWWSGDPSGPIEAGITHVARRLPHPSTLA